MSNVNDMIRMEAKGRSSNPIIKREVMGTSSSQSTTHATEVDQVVTEKSFGKKPAVADEFDSKGTLLKFPYIWSKPE